MPSAPDRESQAVALFDGRPFFEKALRYGVQHGTISPEKLATMRLEGPKGMVQIARYFGTEYLRPDLERARDRLVNLVSLYLQESSGGDLQKAAQSLRDHSLLSRSKGGSDMLKALIGMPQNSHFGMHERAGFRDEHIPLLAKWSLRSLADYHAERARRTHTAQVVEAAVWMAGPLGVDAEGLEEAGKDAEAVIRTALLVQVCGLKTMPDWPAYERMVLALRRRYAGKPHGGATGFPLVLPRGLPAHLVDVVKPVQASVLADLPRILDPALPVRKLFDQTPAFLGRYFWREDLLADVQQFERANSAVWDKATGGHADDSALLTLFLRIATHGSHTTMLTEKSAVTLLRKIQKSGLDTDLPRQFVRQHAPMPHQADYLHLWDVFLEEAAPTLRSDTAHARQDALALLRRECNIA
jgi:hypothetical protein